MNKPQTQPIQAFIFDLDGVIVDTAKYHYTAWKNIANELGFDFTPSDNERLKGVSRMQSLEILLSIGNLSLSGKEKELVAHRKNEQYKALISNITPNEILPGAKDFIEHAQTRGIATALGSASKNAMPILNSLRITNLFDAIIDGNSVEKTKPAPDVFLKAAEALNILPQNCIVFEDAEAGIEAAINAGMRSVGIGNPTILNKANFVVEGLGDIDFETLKQKLCCDN